MQEESPFHCTDIFREQAIEECELYEGCSIENNFLTDKCENIRSCKNVLEGKTGDEPSLFLIFLSIVLLAVAIYLAIKAGLFKMISEWFNKPLPELPEQESAFWKVLSPFSSNPKARNRIWKLKNRRYHKTKEQERKDFFKEVGLALPEKKEDEFTKLARVYKFYEKHKLRMVKELSKKERKIFQNLEEVVELNKKNTFNKEKTVEKVEARKIVEELREISGK